MGSFRQHCHVLATLGLRTICDLRSDAEGARFPNKLPAR
jgi:hypothetical protein